MTSVFSAMNSVPPISYFRSSRILSVQPKHTTRCHRFHHRKNSLPLILCFICSSSTQWILSSTSITFLQMLCAVTQGSNPFTTNSRSPSWKLMSKGEREITSKLVGERDHIKGEKQSQGPNLQERSQGGREYSRIPDAWCSRGEMPHVFFGGKTCSYELIWI